MVGDKLLVNGWAHDIVEAAKIMRIVRANFPGRAAYPEAVRIPVDRAKAGLLAEEYGPEGSLYAAGTETMC